MTAGNEPSFLGSGMLAMSTRHLEDTFSPIQLPASSSRGRAVGGQRPCLGKGNVQCEAQRFYRTTFLSALLQVQRGRDLPHNQSDCPATGPLAGWPEWWLVSLTILHLLGTEESRRKMWLSLPPPTCGLPQTSLRFTQVFLGPL